jgi:ribonuclease-3
VTDGRRPEPEEVFQTGSSVEAEVVRGLLDAHGIRSVVGMGGHMVFRILVHPEHVARAASLIAGHIDEAAATEVRRLSEILGPLEERLAYKFRDLGLLEHALTHRSRAHEDASGGVIDNESLEFLGDAVLGFVIADMLFNHFPKHDEGYKSKVKASIVSSASLARLAEDIQLGRFLLLGRGEEKTGGRNKHAILADCFEAVIAAIYLDGGVDAAREFIEGRFEPMLIQAGDQADHATFTEDWKSALQEWLQANGRGLPHYRLVRTEGPAHRRLFVVEVMVQGEPIAEAEGRAKKEAEQQAAKSAINKLSGERVSG